MARRVDQVELVRLSAELVAHADRVQLDRDSALPLELHRIEHLRLHLARLYGSGGLEEPIGQRRLAVVDVRDDREVSNPLLI